MSEARAGYLVRTSLCTCTYRTDVLGPFRAADVTLHQYNIILKVSSREREREREGGGGWYSYKHNLLSKFIRTHKKLL